MTCEDCGQSFENLMEVRASKRYCSPKCRYRARDRRRQAEDPEKQRARSRAYYAANRERVLEKAAARQRLDGLPRTA